MATISANERELLKDKAAFAARVALGRTLITAYGYGMLAAAAGSKIIEENGDLSTLNPFFMAAGLALHVLAIYLAPIGNSDET